MVRLLMMVVLLIAGCAVNENSVVKITSNGNIGSGVVIKKFGNRYWIATADHVICFGGWKVNGEESADPMDYKGYIKLGDAAIISIVTKTSYTPLPMATARVGDEVRLFGYPGAMQGVLACTQGHVSATLSTLFDAKMWYDGGCAPGFSGGPIVDKFGRVVGIASSVYMSKVERDNHYYYLPFDSVLLCIPSEIFEGLMLGIGSEY